MPKFIFITGGVISGIGKGITAASIGRLLKARGLKVASQKLDPYINVDPGTMSPYQHGEVFVTEDGAETDLDLGHYERFIDEDLNKYSNITSGKVYWNVLNKERNGEYLGETVQVIPHITNEIKSFIYNVGAKTNADIVITEVGGTIGDIESQPFIEAIRQVSLEVGLANCLFVHVTLVPYIISSGEYKTKPTQHSVKELQSLGITPNIIVFRTDEHVDRSIIRKIALFCNVKEDCVIENLTVPSLYEAPIELEKKNLSTVICRELGLTTQEPDLHEWKAMLSQMNSCTSTVHIALVGKYVALHDAYLSVAEALKHAGIANNVLVEIKWVDSDDITAENVHSELDSCDGIILPGGFGKRGTEGMIETVRYARENNIPFFGICLGLQIAVIEFVRHVCGRKEANSTEFDENTPDPVIAFMPDQNNEIPKGGTMRLGSYPCLIREETRMAEAYRAELISERHRHRYEFNNNYRDLITQNGMVISGTSPDGHIVETVEIPANAFFVAVQFHPEFKSRPNRAHPLFRTFIKAASNCSKGDGYAPAELSPEEAIDEMGTIPSFG